jgi:hypothetical protein
MWDENVETPETEPEPVEISHSDDWGDTEEPAVAPTEGN